MYAIKKEMIFAIFKSKLARAILVASLILANFILAEVSVNFSFVAIVFIFSYLAVAGILYKKTEPIKPFQKRFKGLFTFANIMVVLQKWIGYLFMALVIVGIVVQVYFKYFA